MPIGSRGRLLAGHSGGALAAPGRGVTVRPVDFDAYSEPAPIPRGGVTFPLALRPPQGFVPDDPGTWPRVVGRLEFVGGELLYMPPSGDEQQYVATSVTAMLYDWARRHPEFIVGSNEAGMILGGETRAADAAVWRKAELGPRTGGYQRTAPVLAVEVAGRDESEEALVAKARWYLAKGVATVWVVTPGTREVIVLEASSTRRYGVGHEISSSPLLPGLAAKVARFFEQLS